jgi:hypothetical protein
MSQTKQERNKALVLEAFDTLFNKRAYVAAEPYWSLSKRRRLLPEQEKAEKREIPRGFRCLRECLASPTPYPGRDFE